MLLADLVDLYVRVFARILSREDAKASPYTRYYVAVSMPLPWKQIMTVFGGVLAKKGKLEDATAHSIPISIVPPPCVWRWPYTLLRRTDVVCISVLPPCRASSFLGSSQYTRGERAKALGWEPQPVVLEDWVDEGITAALAKQQ